MIHIPISDDRVAQFAALFEVHGDGYVYYGDARLGGLPLSAAERDGYVAHFAKVLRTGNRVMVGWIFCAVIGIVVAEQGFGWPSQDLEHYLVFLLPFPWILWRWWRSKKIVLDEIGRRVPVTLPRTYKTDVISRVAAFPLALPLLMIGVGAVLLVQQWRYGRAVQDIGGDLLGIFVIGFGAWILGVKRWWR